MSMLGCGAESGSDNLDALPQEAESGIGSAASALVQVAKEEPLRPTSPTKVRTSPAQTEGRYLVSLVSTTSGSSAELSLIHIYHQTSVSGGLSDRVATGPGATADRSGPV